MNTHIPVAHHSKLFSDDTIAVAAREIISAQGYGNVWRAETQREAEALAVAALESAHAVLAPSRATVAAALIALRNEYGDCPLLGQEWAIKQLDTTIAKLGLAEETK